MSSILNEYMVVYSEEADRVMDFICETRDGKYTAEKPDLAHIIYSRMEIQESEGSTILNDCVEEEIILYGVSY